MLLNESKLWNLSEIYVFVCDNLAVVTGPGPSQAPSPLAMYIHDRLSLDEANAGQDTN